MSHEGAQRAVGRTPGTRAPTSTSQVPRSAQRSTSEPPKHQVRGIVQAEGILQKTRWQQEEGDKDARPSVLTAESPAGASTPNQRSCPGS